MALRIGKPRGDIGGRGEWRAKLYGPTERYARYRISFKDSATGKWVTRQVPTGEDHDVHFDKIERALDSRVAQPTGDRRPTMRALVGRYLTWLESKGRDETYVKKVANVLDVWVVRSHGDLTVEGWSPEHSLAWIGAARRAGLSPSRVEDLGVALSGMRKTAFRKGPDGTRWLDPSDDPMEGVEYSRSSTMEGAHRDWVPPTARPLTGHVESLIEAARASAPWSWMVTQLGVGAFCGLRLSEQLAVRAVDIDFANQVIRVWHSVRWPRPNAGVEWGLKPTKTKVRREVPYPSSLHGPLLDLCRESLGLSPDATECEVAVAQGGHYDEHLRELDARVVRTGRARPISPHEGLLFVDSALGLPPTKEKYGEQWRQLRSRSTWPAAIPWRNARHHTATWWRAVSASRTGVPESWENIAHWLGHSVKTCLDHYVRAGEDAGFHARAYLDEV